MKPIGTGRITPSNVVAVIMGGGAGTRLFPLTRDRSKPAVPIAGKYRLVDIPISNCINSDIRNIYVLTQFNSASLHRHIHQSYRFDRFARGFVEILAAQQTPSSTAWYQGTADAVRQNMRYFLQEEYEYVIILSGDQLYRMDFRQVLQQHVQTGAEVTISAIPVKRHEASSLGILQVNDERRISRFVEKPKEAKQLDQLRIEDPLLSAVKLTSSDDYYLASMGIYVFNRDVLAKVLDNDKADFGKHVIPDSISGHTVFAYIFQGYWEDVGTIRSFYEANLALCGSEPSFNFYDRRAPVYTHARFLPASKIFDSTIRTSLVGDGCIIHRSIIENSIIGVRSYISPGCEIRRTVMMGCDFYQSPHQELEQDGMGIPHMSIGKNSKITGAIIDKNAHIGQDVVVTDKTGAPDFDGPDYYIRDGIVVIPKNAVIPAGTGSELFVHWIQQALDLFLHLDKHLNDAMAQHGTVWTYALLFAIIFSETGFVVTPFLPGDSLLFAAGALAASPGSPLSVGLTVILLIVAAVAGNTTNYLVGRLFGDKLSVRFPRIIKPAYLAKTQAFYEKYGGETIIITRFVPIVRTFAPFVAGVGHMRYLKFSGYNVAGGVLWVVLLTYGGYLFGGLPWVKTHFGIVELAIIILSIMPMVIEFLRARKKV